MRLVRRTCQKIKKITTSPSMGRTCNGDDDGGTVVTGGADDNGHPVSSPPPPGVSVRVTADPWEEGAGAPRPPGVPGAGQGRQQACLAPRCGSGRAR